jgi:hypothetical protein
VKTLRKESEIQDGSEPIFSFGMSLLALRTRYLCVESLRTNPLQLAVQSVLPLQFSFHRADS